MRPIKYILLAAAFAASSVGFACNSDIKMSNKDVAIDSKPIPTPTLDQHTLGKKVYENNCTFCHMEDGSGGEIVFEGKTLDADNLTDDKRTNLSDEKMIGYIMNGVTDKGMPAFKEKLSEGEMRDVVFYIRELQKK